jgi:hypothetical protein
MRETQKGEGLGFSFSTLLSVLSCEPSEFDQPRLFRIDFQTELGEAGKGTTFRVRLPLHRSADAASS